MEKSKQFILQSNSIKILFLSCLIFGTQQIGFGQNIDIKAARRAVEKELNWFYRTLNTVANISCNRGTIKDTDIPALVEDNFTGDAKIWVSNIGKDKRTTKHYLGYLDYFGKVSRLCLSTFKRVSFSSKRIHVNENDITCLENGCTAKVEVLQTFIGERDNGAIYCDQTIKIFTISVKKNRDTYETKISSVEVGTTAPCGTSI